MTKNYNNQILNECSWFAEKHRGKNKRSGPYWSTIIRFPFLFDEAVRLQERVDALEKYIADYCASTIQEGYNEIEWLKNENDKISDLLHHTIIQLEVATDLGDKRWKALNSIYVEGEKRTTNWCKRKAGEGLGIK